MDKLEMFFFNGHGESVPNQLKNNIINLSPGQFVIMYKDMCPLPGTASIQDIIFNHVLRSNTPEEFINNIKNIKIKSGELFGYFGSMTKSTHCPNLLLSTYQQIFEILKTKGEFRRNNYEDRFGLFNVPININEGIDTLKGILPPHVSPLGKIKIDINSYLSYLDILQYKLINSKNIFGINFPIYPTTDYSSMSEEYSIFDFTYLKEIVDMFNGNPFILFMNVCRSIDTTFTYNTTLYTKELNSLLTELKNPITFQSLPYNIPYHYLESQDYASQPQYYYTPFVDGATSTLSTLPTLPILPILLTPSTLPTLPTPVSSKKLPFIDPKTGEPKIFNGGDINYKQKYLKYKQKYLTLKNKI